MTDIVERLRSLNADFLHEEAADEIERLRKERTRLAADLAQAHRDILPWIGRASRLAARNSHLRAALKQAEEGLRDAGAIYGADAVRAALGEAG